MKSFELRHLLLPLAPVVFQFCLPVGARANTISGIVYCNVSSADAYSTPTPGASVSGIKCASFQTSSINFVNNNTSTNNIGAFLNSNNTVRGTINYLNGFTAASNLDYSVFEFTGSAWFTNGQQYSATHDDGTVMQVNGLTVINSPGATSSRTDTFVFNGVTGQYEFQYDFSEIQGATVYRTDATQTPEPATLLLLGTGLLGAGVLRHQRQSAQPAAAA